MESILAALRAMAEPTRLRLVALCAESELTVTELATILGQSQPRISRHLKVLCEAGVLDRFREGSWVFLRAARVGASASRLLFVHAASPAIERDCDSALSKASRSYLVT